MTTDIHDAPHEFEVSHPGILGGRPVFRGTHLTQATLFKHLADGLTFGCFLESSSSVQRQQATEVLRDGLERSEHDAGRVRILPV